MTQKLVAERDPTRFYSMLAPFLSERRAENDLFLGVVSALRASSDQDFYLAYVLNGDSIEGAVAMTRQGKPLLSYPCSQESCYLFAHDMALQFFLVGVKGPEQEAKWFSETFTQLTERPGKLLNVLLCYELTDVPPNTGVRIEVAEKKDVDLLSRWTKDFFKETLPYELQEDSLFERTMEAVEAGQIFVLKDPTPCCMVKVIRTTNYSSRLTYVYTPPEKRGRGYATSLVSEVSRKLLASGDSLIVLYTISTDLITNKMYKRLGFDPVGELHDIGFASY